MDTAVEAAATRQTSKVADPRKAQSPIEFFEQHAHSIWASDLDPTEKALKLYSVSDSIGKYLRKTSIELRERARSQDAWKTQSCQRAVAYLEQLSIDLRRLAIQCQQANVGGNA